MFIELLPESGQFFKVNMHSHSTLSDGKMTCQEVKDRYKSLGYHAVCFTDHEIMFTHLDLCDENFVALHGYEVSIKQNLDVSSGFLKPLYHLNLISKYQDNPNMPKFFRNHPSKFGNSMALRQTVGNYDELIEKTEYSVDWLNEYTKDVVNRGFLVNYNHPQWSLQTKDDYVGLKYIHSVEVINGSCEFLNDNTSLHFEQMLRAGMRVCPTAGDDNHNLENTGLAWTMIKADSLSYASLIDGYEKGNCYATQGPDILHLVLDGTKIRVKTSPCFAVQLLSQGRCGEIRRAGSEPLTEAVFDYRPDRFGSYFRIEVRDMAGNRAFSNAYYCEDLESRN